MTTEFDEHGTMWVTPEPEPAAETPAAEPVETETGPEVDDDTLDPHALQKELQKVRREAANYRTKLREVEARAGTGEDYEATLARLATLERAEVERQAAEVLIDPSDVYRYSDPETQQSFFDAQFGSIARDPIIETAKRIASERPHLARDTTPKAPPSQQPLEGLRAGASPESRKTEVSWASALRRSL